MEHMDLMHTPRDFANKIIKAVKEYFDPNLDSPVYQVKN